MRNSFIAAGLISFTALCGCSTSAEDSMGRSLENAGSAVNSVGNELLPGQTVENSAGRALGNAGEAVGTAVQPSGGKIWDKPPEAPPKKKIK